MSDHADTLLLILAVQDTEKRATSDAIPTVSGDLGPVPVSLYQELSRHDLLNVTWADNSPYIVQVTDKGRNYAEGWFQDQMDNNAQSITIAPMFNNNNESNASASATIQDVTLGQTIGKIVDLNISDQVKDEAQEAVRQLDSAAQECTQIGGNGPSVPFRGICVHCCDARRDTNYDASCVEWHERLSRHGVPAAPPR